ncbi:MAG: 4Fe-4S dicluster domain-containing protein, partial [Planctomycetota bacterium]|nr:4Fe-4S dicluster domain-containing protein [Planctomycetota bacterium]
GLLVTSAIGRPIKIEGNPLHPASLGATDAKAQATILTMYDPDRSQTFKHLGEISTWEAFLQSLRGSMPAEELRGAGMYVLSAPSSSPTLILQKAAFVAKYPAAQWLTYEVEHRDHSRSAVKTAFGQNATPVFQYDQAKVVLSLDSDFLCSGPSAVRNARDFMSGRTVLGQNTEMNRLYVVESTVTPTGATADHRLALPPSSVADFALALAAELGLAPFQAAATAAAASPSATFDPKKEAHALWVRTVANDLRANRGRSLVVVGEQQPELVHLVALAINQELENVGKTVRYIAAVDTNDGSSMSAIETLVRDLNADKVDVLVMFDSNPVYNTPAGFEFAKALQKAKLSVHFGMYEDETSELCHWHIPACHFLEGWGDTRSFDGTASIVQPLIAPLYDSRTVYDLMSALVDQSLVPTYDSVRATWTEQWPNGFDAGWNKAVHDGLIPESASKELTVTANITAEQVQTAVQASPFVKAGAAAPDTLQVSFLLDPHIGDGSWANNGWLQELPKPLTKLTWDNAVLVSKATAEKYGVTNGDMVKLEYEGRSVNGPIWMVPGHPNQCATLFFGYGRKRGGRTAVGHGFSAYEIWSNSGQALGAGLKLSKTGEIYPLASTQIHHNVEGRNIVHKGTLNEYKLDLQNLEKSKKEHGKKDNEGHDKKHADEHGGVHLKVHAANHHPFGEKGPPTLLPERVLEGQFQWGMSINMTACTGCNACVVACQAENNIPVVGKEQVIAGREMQWMRIDLYYDGTEEQPEATHQPMLCQHCENAPCEVVCPVAATTHSPEGINEMTYNRCVGTRYCSNNCPYKVRRFNFLQYVDETTPVLKMLRNPEVTVRSRGVMEKCTYCVQRVNMARIAAKNHSIETGEVTIPDGTLQTACQQACPARAIVFGDTKDPNSEVSKRRADPLNYGVLEELGVRPRTTYLAKLTNPADIGTELSRS